MKTPKILLIAGLVAGLFACSDGAKQRTQEAATDLNTVATKLPEEHGTEIKEVKLTTPLDQNMVKEGLVTYDLKCSSCHRLDGTRLVGPSWKGVTERREPVWIMNMITNVDMMLDKDPEVQKMLEECLVRMPNQNLSENQAREVLEFMRKNDGVQ